MFRGYYCVPTFSKQRRVGKMAQKRKPEGPCKSCTRFIPVSYLFTYPRVASWLVVVSYLLYNTGIKTLEYRLFSFKNSLKKSSAKKRSSDLLPQSSSCPLPLPLLRLPVRQHQSRTPAWSSPQDSGDLILCFII